MSSGEDDSSALADPLDDLGLSESEDPDLRDPLQTELVDAAAAGKFFAIEAIMSRGADPDVADAEGRTPLHLAVLASREPAVLVLLELGANADVADRWGFSPLHIAAEQGKVRCAERLLDGGAGGTVHDNKGRTPWTVAMAAGGDDQQKKP
ncbi:ankyrin repeat-containing domain protein [Baffinella frigidus]|nr:ankyrin repeat-containing domain protein [Cryptophyta sp. CCMP2293]